MKRRLLTVLAVVLCFLAFWVPLGWASPSDDGGGGGNPYPCNAAYESWILKAVFYDPYHSPSGVYAWFICTRSIPPMGVYHWHFLSYTP